jgi:hypothetical protein
MMLTELTGVVAIGSIDWFVFNYLSFLLIQKPPLQNSVDRSVSTMSVIKLSLLTLESLASLKTD